MLSKTAEANKMIDFLRKKYEINPLNIPSRFFSAPYINE